MDRPTLSLVPAAGAANLGLAMRVYGMMDVIDSTYWGYHGAFRVCPDLAGFDSQCRVCCRLSPVGIECSIARSFSY
jgi:hypothetical protein